MKVLSWFQKNLILAVPLYMLGGLFFGYVVDKKMIVFDIQSLKSLVMPATFLMIYPMMINFQPQKLLNKGGNKALFLSILLNFGIVPFLAFGVGKIFFANEPILAAGLLLASLLPTSGMTISWTGFAKGNMQAAVKMTIVGLIAGSFLTPIYLTVLIGKTVDMDLIEIVKTIVFTIFIPMILGVLTRIFIIKIQSEERYTKNWVPHFSEFSTLGVLSIVFIAIALKAASLIANPSILIQILTPLILLYGINYVISTFVGKKFLDRGEGIALVYGTVMRNLSIALAIAMNSFGPQAALILALSYIVQVQSGAWYVKLSDKIFGKP